MIRVEKNIHQHGRGYFSTVFFNDCALAEKHDFDGAVLCFSLQAEKIALLISNNVPMIEGSIDWKYAAELLSQLNKAPTGALVIVMDLYFRIKTQGYYVVQWHRALKESTDGYLVVAGFGNRAMGKELYFATMLEF